MYKNLLKSSLVTTLIILAPLVLMVSSGFVYDYSAGFNEKEDEMNVIKGYFFSNGEVSELLNEKEESHMEDVKNLIVTSQLIFILLIVTFAYLKFNDELSKKHYVTGGKAGLYFTLGVMVFALISFERLFYYFHLVFFPMGNFTFPEQSILIQLFPPEFFLQISIAWLIASFVISLTTLLLSKYL